MLPAVAYWAMKQIDRSWLDVGEPALPGVPHFPPESQCARREKRACADSLMRRSVAMPADSGAGRILRHNELLKRIRGHSADLACDVDQWPKVVGNARVGARLLARENIFVTKGVYAAVALIAVKFEWLQLQLFKFLDQALLLPRGAHVWDLSG